jgi:hypothetical protein
MDGTSLCGVDILTLIDTEVGVSGIGTFHGEGEGSGTYNKCSTYRRSFQTKRTPTYRLDC